MKMLKSYFSKKHKIYIVSIGLKLTRNTRSHEIEVPILRLLAAPYECDLVWIIVGQKLQKVIDVYPHVVALRVDHLHLTGRCLRWGEVIVRVVDVWRWLAKIVNGYKHQLEPALFPI